MKPMLSAGGLALERVQVVKESDGRESRKQWLLDCSEYE